MSYYQLADGRVYDCSYAPSNAAKLTNAAGKLAVKNQARDDLRAILTAGDTVYTILRHVSRSGMMRHISVVIKTDDGLRDITGLVSDAIDNPTNDNGALKVGGCGMDMGFHVVYSLGSAIYPEGFKLAGNQYGRNGDKSGFDNDGGYAFRQSWI